MRLVTTSSSAQPQPGSTAQAKRVGRGLASAALLLLTAVYACSGPQFIDRVTIANSTPYDLDVEVAGSKREGWLVLGSVRRESEDFVEQVMDQGETWIFRFRHLGSDAGEVRISRPELERNRWRIEIPTSVGARLQEQGAEPSPKSTG